MFLKVMGLIRRTRQSAGTGGGEKKTDGDGRIPSTVASQSWRSPRQTKVDPKLVSQWLHKLGVEVYRGKHRVEQLPLRIPAELVELLSKGPNHVLKFLDERVWGITATVSGTSQLGKFCRFIELHKEGIGVELIASRIQVHRSTIAEWRDGTDQPYLVRASSAALRYQVSPSQKLIPLHLDSGGNEQSDWIQVPTQVIRYADVEKVVNQLTPLPQTYELGKQLGLSEPQTQSMRTDLFAYLLGMMVGDLAKHGGQQERFSSMNLDLQLTQKHISNEELGIFVCLAANSLGIRMARIHDKAPTGYTKSSKNPTAAYRWISERTPLFAWMFSRCVGLGWNQLTSYDPIQMDWIF